MNTLGLFATPFFFFFFTTLHITKVTPQNVIIQIYQRIYNLICTCRSERCKILPACPTGYCFSCSGVAGWEMEERQSNWLEY